MQIQQGETKIWNEGGFAPVGWEDLEAGARMLHPNGIVWAIEVKILRCHVWHPDFRPGTALQVVRPP